QVGSNARRQPLSSVPSRLETGQRTFKRKPDGFLSYKGIFHASLAHQHFRCRHNTHSEGEHNAPGIREAQSRFPFRRNYQARWTANVFC
ncbi:MAG: hypothetical protein WBV90_12310, partial [Terrimicrobiaceae bacterium]